jgi:hypothetical protein
VGRSSSSAGAAAVEELSRRRRRPRRRPLSRGGCATKSACFACSAGEAPCKAVAPALKRGGHRLVFTKLSKSAESAARRVPGSGGAWRSPVAGVGEAGPLLPSVARGTAAVQGVEVWRWASRRGGGPTASTPPHLEGLPLASRSAHLRKPAASGRRHGGGQHVGTIYPGTRAHEPPQRRRSQKARRGTVGERRQGLGGAEGAPRTSRCHRRACRPGGRGRPCSGRSGRSPAARPPPPDPAAAAAATGATPGGGWGGEGGGGERRSLPGSHPLPSTGTLHGDEWQARAERHSRPRAEWTHRSLRRLRTPLPCRALRTRRWRQLRPDLPGAVFRPFLRPVARAFLCARTSRARCRPRLRLPGPFSARTAVRRELGRRESRAVRRELLGYPQQRGLALHRGNAP